MKEHMSSHHKAQVVKDSTLNQGFKAFPWYTYLIHCLIPTSNIQAQCYVGDPNVIQRQPSLLVVGKTPVLDIKETKGIQL